MTAESKLLTMRDAIARHVPSGSMVLLGAQLEQMIPFAAGHELIRQSRRDLALVGPISDILFDQLIGAGCVSRVMAAWVGNVSAGVGYCFRRAVERGAWKSWTIRISRWRLRCMPERSACRSCLLTRRSAAIC
jgi:glutaconate CoA-transferase, subunit A